MVSLDSGVRPKLSELKEVFDTDPTEGGIADAGLRAYLNAAHDVVESRLGGEGMPEATLRRIEKFVAAHLASAQDPRIATERVADVRLDYQRVEDGSGSDYWQHAIMLDSSGKLKGATKGTARFGAFGPGRD